MPQQKSHTAILLFTRSTAAEAAHKHLHQKNNRKGNKQIIGCLTAATLQTIKASGFPYFVIDEQEQHGTSFGEKLAHAVEVVFSKGFTDLLVLGNDCPALKVSHLSHAAQQLQNHQAVGGATPRGGLYLIGLRKASFNCQAFKNLGWQTSTAATEFAQLYSAAGYTALPPLPDCNTAHQLQLSLSLLAGGSLLRIRLQAAIASANPVYKHASFLIRTVACRRYYGLRAPPAVAF